MKRSAVAIIFLLSACLLPLHRVQAQGVENTITVDPAKLDFVIGEDAQDASSVLTITNQYDVPVKLGAGFRSVDENSGSIIPSGEIGKQLADSLTLSAEEFTIAPHTKYFLTVGVKNVAQLQPGGQYATLVLSDRSQEASKATVRPQLSVGIFITKTQGKQVEVVLARHDVLRKKFNFPTLFKVALLNDGNVHITPRGYMRMYDQNDMLFETVLNEQSQTILPAKQYEQAIRLPLIKRWWPRRVTLELGYRADGIEEFKIYREEFWFVPVYLFFVGALLAGAGGYGAFWLYKKRTA